MNRSADRYALGRRSTPTNERRSFSGKRRRLCSSNEVVRHVMSTNFSAASGERMYQPNQSLYDGHYEQEHSEDSDLGQENNSQSINMGVPPGPTSTELVKMIQEQQHLLHQLLESQQKMQSKQEEFDQKIKELTKASESSSVSSPTNPQRKFKIKRSLTVIIDCLSWVAHNDLGLFIFREW